MKLESLLEFGRLHQTRNLKKNLLFTGMQVLLYLEKVHLLLEICSVYANNDYSVKWGQTGGFIESELANTISPKTWHYNLLSK